MGTLIARTMSVRLTESQVSHNTTRPQKVGATLMCGVLLFIRRVTPGVVLAVECGRAGDNAVYTACIER